MTDNYPDRPGPPREVQEDAAARERSMEGARAYYVSRITDASYETWTMLDPDEAALNERVDAIVHEAQEQARAEEREWTRVTEEVEHGGPYLITNNPDARLNDGSMSHVWVARRIFKKGNEFCAYEDSLAMKKIYGVTHYKPVTPPEAPND